MSNEDCALRIELNWLDVQAAPYEEAVLKEINVDIEIIVSMLRLVLISFSPELYLSN
jgi:hypothetical protein